MSGHVWLSEDDLRALTDEMLVQGMPWPVERLGTDARIDRDELGAVVAAAAPEPKAVGDSKLGLEWLRFLERPAVTGGLPPPPQPDPPARLEHHGRLSVRRRRHVRGHLLDAGDPAAARPHV